MDLIRDERDVYHSVGYSHFAFRNPRRRGRNDEGYKSANVARLSFVSATFQHTLLAISFSIAFPFHLSSPPDHVAKTIFAFGTTPSGLKLPLLSST